METPSDSYLTIEAPAEALYKDKGSRFLAFAYPVANEEQIRERVDALRKKYFDATHHCYAWRLGPSGDSFRAVDDGEPSSTAGRPILGQMLSRNVTNALIVVVRYFGGTKLGVPGLIAAYRESAAAALDASSVVERTVDAVLEIGFGYLVLNDVMRIVKEMQPQVLAQRFDNACTMTLAIRSSAEGDRSEKGSRAWKACGSIRKAMCNGNRRVGNARAGLPIRSRQGNIRLRTEAQPQGREGDLFDKRLL